MSAGDNINFLRRTIMERISDHKVTDLTYDKALELFNKQNKVRGYPESYRRFDQHYRVAIKDDVECGGYIDFWQFESYTTAKEIKQQLYMSPQSKDDIPLPRYSYWHEDERHGYSGESSHRNSKPYAFYSYAKGMNSLVRVYKNNFIMASTGYPDVPNSWGRNFVSNFLNRGWNTIERHNKYDYFKHTDGKYYCSNHKGLQIQDGYLVDAYRPKKVNSNFYTKVDFKKYDEMLEPYYNWLRDVMSTCTDNEIPKFEPVGLNWEDFSVSGVFKKYMKNTIDKLKNGECTDDDYLDLTCVLLHYAPNNWEQHGALNVRRQDVANPNKQNKFVPMSLLRNNVAHFFTLNDDEKETSVYLEVGVGKRAWDTEYSHDHWSHKNQ